MGGAYVNEDSIQGAGYTFIFLGIISVGTRFIVRRWKKVSIGIDDYFSLAALVFTISYCITMIIGEPMTRMSGRDRSITYVTM